jgi:tRNA threonylcarbamoyladenosine biosynthesis protein TsaB
MTILALDTATVILSVALSSGDTLWHFEIDGGLRHAELLMDTIDRLVKSAGLEPGDIDIVACMKGPGSFTGLRISFAAVKGLALALGIPMVSVPTLDCMAAPQSAWPGIVLPVMDAKKGCFFTALYRGGDRISDYMDAPTAEIAAALGKNEPVLFTGPDAGMLLPEIRDILAPSDGAGPQGLFLDPGGRRGRARELLDIVKKGAIPHTGEDVFSGPLYLRKSDAELTFHS